MSKRERTVWDDIVELGREIIEKLDDILNPEKRHKPVPIPVPVRNDYPPMRDPNDSPYR